MDYMINFPNLGIHLSHVGKNVTIGGFTIAYYGICIAACHGIQVLPETCMVKRER